MLFIGKKTLLYTDVTSISAVFGGEIVQCITNISGLSLVMRELSPIKMALDDFLNPIMFNKS